MNRNDEHDARVVEIAERYERERWAAIVERWADSLGDPRSPRATAAELALRSVAACMRLNRPPFKEPA